MKELEKGGKSWKKGRFQLKRAIFEAIFIPFSLAAGFSPGLGGATGCHGDAEGALPLSMYQAGEDLRRKSLCRAIFGPERSSFPSFFKRFSMGFHRFSSFFHRFWPGSERFVAVWFSGAGPGLGGLQEASRKGDLRRSPEMDEELQEAFCMRKHAKSGLKRCKNALTLGCKSRFSAR